MESCYDNLLLIYYSGTGNSKRVSEWIVAEAVHSGLNTHIVSFHKFDPESIKSFTGKTLIGFFSATHGFNMPHSMLRFLFRFSELKGSDVFIGNTRAGMKLWKFFVPGLSGIALYFPALIMFVKGYKVRSMYPVDLPSNWISLHPGLRKKVIYSMVEHYERLTKQFAVNILSGKRIFIKSFALLPLDILVAPIALGYYFVGRYILAKTFVANYHCNNCGLCIQQCPTQSIILAGNRPYWKFSCESCMKCMNYCPERAIETAHSLVFVLLLLMSIFLNPWLSATVSGWFGTSEMDSGLPEKLIYFVIHASLTITIFYFGYKLLHYLMRFPGVNKIITYTSLTSWKFWRRYKMPNRPITDSQKSF